MMIALQTSASSGTKRIGSELPQQTQPTQCAASTNATHASASSGTKRDGLELPQLHQSKLSAG